MPAVSVVIPVYNSEKYVEKCICSVMEQTLSELEIIIINDGSTDESGRILRELTQKDSRIVLLEQANQGVAAARNQGVEKAVINLGGNVAVLGEKAKDTPWNIAIERPYSDRTEMMGYVSVKDATVVTSGIYERKFEQDGVLYHHVLDPRSGYPVDTDLEAVTIRAAKGNSGFCDGLSTVCLMLGKDKAQALIETLQEEHPEMKLEAAFIDKNDAMTQTDGMDVKKDE